MWSLRNMAFRLLKTCPRIKWLAYTRNRLVDEYIRYIKYCWKHYICLYFWKVLYLCTVFTLFGLYCPIYDVLAVVRRDLLLVIHVGIPPRTHAPVNKNVGWCKPVSWPKDFWIQKLYIHAYMCMCQCICMHVH